MKQKDVGNDLFGAQTIFFRTRITAQKEQDCAQAEKEFQQERVERESWKQSGPVFGWRRGGYRPVVVVVVAAAARPVCRDTV